MTFAAPRRVGIGAVHPASVVNSMYGDEDDVDGATLGAAVDFEVFPAEDIQGFMQFPEESGQVRQVTNLPPLILSIIYFNLSCQL